MSGEKVTGEQIGQAGWSKGLPQQLRGPVEELAGLVTPLNVSDIYKVMLEQGVPAAVAAALIVNFGDSVNNFQAKQKGKIPFKAFKHRGKYGPKGKG